MISFTQFVNQNDKDLKNMFSILKNRITVVISYNSFCKFCYEHTY